jgi:hypothetical protein
MNGIIGLKSLRICSFLARRNSLKLPRVSEGIGGNQRRQMSECGARTAAGSLEAVFESSDVERFGWILMEV